MASSGPSLGDVVEPFMVRRRVLTSDDIEGGVWATLRSPFGAVVDGVMTDWPWVRAFLRECVEGAFALVVVTADVVGGDV